MTAAPMLTVAEVAARLACRTDTVLALIREGHLPAAPLNPAARRPTWRIDPADLALYLDRHRTRPPEPTPPPIRRRRRAPPLKDRFPQHRG